MCRTLANEAQWWPAILSTLGSDLGTNLGTTLDTTPHSTMGSTMVPDNFQSLSRRAADGDLAAQSTLCQAYENEVRIVARVHLGAHLRPHLDSLDVTQSVHRSVLSGLMAGRFIIDNSRGLVALACLIARRKIAKQWRKHRRQVRLDSVRLGSATNSASHTTLNTTSNTSVTVQQLIDNAGGEPTEIGDLDELSPSELACVRLNLIRAAVTPIERLLIDRKLAGKTSPQIAQELNLDPVAVRVRWSRLSAKLRKLGTQE